MIKETRNKSSGLWLVILKNITTTTVVNIPQEHLSTTARVKMTSPAKHPTLYPTTNASAAVIKSISTKRELVIFIHTCCFFPVISTWIRAMNNGKHASFLGLTSTLVVHYLPIELPTSQGHMHKRKQGIRSATARADASVLTAGPNAHEACSKVI